MLAAAMNHVSADASTTRRRWIQRYVAEISRPLLDRIDIHTEVPAVRYKELRGGADSLQGDVGAGKAAGPLFPQRAGIDVPDSERIAISAPSIPHSGPQLPGLHT